MCTSSIRSSFATPRYFAYSEKRGRLLLYERWKANKDRIRFIIHDSDRHHSLPFILFRCLLVCIHCLSENRETLSYSDRELVCKLSLQAHHQAQGRIGSGYDIITGVFGSCVYQRCLSMPFQCRFEPFHFPDSLTVLFSYGGSASSSTPHLVKRIGEWRKQSSSDEKRLWEDYRQGNEALITLLTEEIDENRLKEAFRHQLETVHAIGVASETSLVPENVYELMKETAKIDWVMGCMVAGAGGADSFYCVCNAERCQREVIEAVWQKWDYHVSEVSLHNEGMSISHNSSVSYKQTTKH